jgi:hypothetical protein
VFYASPDREEEKGDDNENGDAETGDVENGDDNEDGGKVARKLSFAEDGDGNLKTLILNECFADDGEGNVKTLILNECFADAFLNKI